jgi:hypothetical protein
MNLVELPTPLRTPLASHEGRHRAELSPRCPRGHTLAIEPPNEPRSSRLRPDSVRQPIRRLLPPPPRSRLSRKHLSPEAVHPGLKRRYRGRTQTRFFLTTENVQGAFQSRLWSFLVTDPIIGVKQLQPSREPCDGPVKSRKRQSAPQRSGPQFVSNSTNRPPSLEK